MTMLPDAVRAYEQELLQKADMLAMGLKGLTSASPERAAELLAEISSRLARAVAAEPVVATVSIGADPPVASPGGNAVPRTVMTLIGSFDCTVASALPA